MYHLFYRPFSPLNMIVLHDFVSGLHSQFFIKRDCAFIGNQVYRDILFAAGKLMGLFHQPGRDAPALIGPVYAQIRNIQPIAEVCEPEKNAYEKAVSIPGGQTD